MNDPKIVSIPNRKPADELADVREKIRALKAREEALRDGFLVGRYDRMGDEYSVIVTANQYEKVDTPKLKRELGMKFLRPFLKLAKFKTVRLKKLDSGKVIEDATDDQEA